MPNKSGKITHEVIVPIRMEIETRKIRAWVTDIGKEDFILGLLWLKQENPDIDWTNGRIILQCWKPWEEILATARRRIASWTTNKLKAAVVATDPVKSSTTSMTPAQSHPTVIMEEVPNEDNKPKELTPESQDSLEEILSSLEKHEVVISYIHRESVVGIHVKKQSPLTQELVDESTIPRPCSIINRFFKSLGGCFTLGLSIDKATIAMELAQTANSRKKDKVIEDLVPEYLHDYYSVFDKGMASRLPGHTEYDHEIKLKPTLCQAWLGPWQGGWDK